MFIECGSRVKSYKEEIVYVILCFGNCWQNLFKSIAYKKLANRENNVFN